MTEFRELAEALACELEDKRAWYGDQNIVRVPEILSLLYPDGIRTEQYPAVLLLVRILDKIGRLCTIRDPASPAAEDAWRDIAGYALCALHDLVAPKRRID